MAYRQGPLISTWTPTITGSSSNPVVGYTTQLGSYQQMGSVVCVKGTVVLSSVSGGSGDIRISLPFTSSNDSCDSSGPMNVASTAFPASATWITGYNTANTNYITLRGCKSAASAAVMSVSVLTSTSAFSFEFIYFV